MRNQKISDLVYLALFLTIIVVMSQVPWLGFIPLGFTTATIIHIPVIIAAIYFGKKMGVYTGFIFGGVSLLTAYLRPTNVFDLFFQNPIISILPRIAFGFVTVIIYNSLKFINFEYLRTSITAFLSTIMHTVLVIGTLILIYYNETKTFVNADKQTEEFTITFALIGLVVLSALGEAIASTLIVPPIISAIRAANKKEGNKDLFKD